MPKRKCLDDVINYVAEKSNGEIQVLSEEYINTKTPIKLLCSCGNVFYRSFKKIKYNHLNCPECTLKKCSENLRTPFETVLKTIQDNGCEYISGDYINSNSILKIRCSCGNIFSKKYAKFKSGQSHCPDCGIKMLSKSKIKYSPYDAKNILQDHGYFMEVDDYVNAATPIPCKCKNNHDCNIILSQLLVGRSGCQRCAIDSHKSFLSHFWNGGEAKAQDEIRKALKEWRANIYKHYNYKCPITGVPVTECAVHHLVSFNSIVDEVCQKYGQMINFQTHIKDIKSYDVFEDIKNEVIQRHNLNIGILINKDIHKIFHKQYGYGNNTPEQFDMFLQNNYGVRLQDIVAS